MRLTFLHVFQWLMDHILVVVAWYIGFFVINLILGSISKRYRKILETSVSDAFLNTCDFIFNWITLPLLHKIVFIVTPYFYRKQVINSYNHDIRSSYETKIRDYELQINLLQNDRHKLRNERFSTTEPGDVYWKGVKAGYALSERNRKKALDASFIPKELNESQTFTLKQIAEGNRTITGLVAAYLEDIGYTKLIWDNEAENKYHYEITDEGKAYLKKLQHPRWAQVYPYDGPDI